MPRRALRRTCFLYALVLSKGSAREELEAAGAGGAPIDTTDPTTAKRARTEGGGGGPPGGAAPASICPPHPASIGGMCALCGASVPQEEAEGSVAFR